MIAALDGDAVYVEGQAPRESRAEGPLIAGNVGDLFAWMLATGVTVLHVHRSALAGLGLPEGIDPPRPREKRPTHPFMAESSLPVSSRALTPSVKCEGVGEILIGAYQGGGSEAGDPFGAAVDGGELLAAVLAFRDALGGWEFRHSAITTGWNLMHARRGRQLTELEVPPADVAGENGQHAGQVEIPYGGRWARAQTDGAGLANVLAWDVNGQRLAACGRLSLGIGGLEHRDPREVAFDKRLPGYHLVTAVSSPYAGEIPAIFEPGWHTTPRIAMAHYLGIPVELAYSWVWTEHVPYLNPWYERMRDARAQLLERDGDRAAQLALGALKQCYLQPLGRLRSHRERQAGSLHYRPHWYDTIIGAELAREYLRLWELAQLGAKVLAVYFDTIIIESDQPAPTSEATLGVLEVSPQLGKYKPVGALEAKLARRILYAGEAPDVGALVKGIKGAHDFVQQGRVNEPVLYSQPPQQLPPPSAGAKTAPQATSSFDEDQLVRLGPPSNSNVIHRASCRYAKRANVLPWRLTSEPGLGRLAQLWLRPCGHCKPYLPADQ